MYYMSKTCPLQIKDEDCWVRKHNSTDAIVIMCHRNSTCKVIYDRCISFCIPPKNGLVISPQSSMFNVKVSGTVTISIFNYSAEAGILELGVGDYRNIIMKAPFWDYYIYVLSSTIYEHKDRIVYTPKGHIAHIYGKLPIIHRGKCLVAWDSEIIIEEYEELDKGEFA